MVCMFVCDTERCRQRKQHHAASPRVHLAGLAGAGEHGSVQGEDIGWTRGAYHDAVGPPALRGGKALAGRQRVSKRGLGVMSKEREDKRAVL